MAKRLADKLTSLLLALWLLAGLTMPTAWAAPADTVTISSVEELLDFSKRCSLDTWSQGKTVVLTADLDLSGRDFAPIPTFGGTFQGQGHTISGLRVTASGSAMGLFRYIQEGAVVQDLYVTGLVAPDGSRAKVGAIAGVNAGAIRNCTFQGTVKGESMIGGIAGLNQAAGEVAGCSMSGTVLGTDDTGGIAGRNLGLLLKCTSGAEVNTISPDTSPSLEDLTLDTTLENLASSGAEEDADTLLNSHSDTGGVAGYSSGVVQSCSNSGTVGYPHVGYNVGGVAGRQSGYLAGCSNTGEVYGRKDVGGVVGQAEPYMALTPGSGTLERLRTELDTLDRLIDRALDDADLQKDEISARLTSIGACTDAARDSSKVLLDHASDFVDGNIASLNSLSASVTAALDEITPALDDLADAADRMESLSDCLEEALDSLSGAADTGGSAMAEARRAVRELRLAGDALRRATGALRDAAKNLSQAVVVDQEAVRQALRDLSAAAADFGGALRQAGEAVKALGDALRPIFPEGSASDAMDQLAEAMVGMQTALHRAGSALTDIAASPAFQWESIQSALVDLRTALSELHTRSGHLSSAAAALKAAFEKSGGLSGDLRDGLAKLQDASGVASAMGRKLESACSSLSDAVETLVKDGPVEFVQLGDETRAAGDDLYAAMSSLSEEMEGLHTAMDSAGDVLSADLRAISRQFNTVFQVLLDALTDLQGGGDAGSSDFIEDTSDEDTASTRQGKVAGCRNTGAVDGDRNVGGIVGSMAIDYDLDPEDDTERFSLGSTYETKAVLQGSVNRGAVTAKKDCAGGLVGRMDLGTTVDCQNYGAVTSTSGNYVGGIAGWADTTVRSSYAKCTLSGGNDIGGIAGWAARMADCYAIITVSEGTERVGAIAGNADLEDGVLSGNRFVDTGTAGIDGISYAGIAEPITFDELRQLPNIPAEFASFLLTLTAGGQVVAQVPFRYGEDLSLIDLPEVPEQAGCYGTWPEFDTSGLNSDITLEAVYTPWVTLVSSAELDGKLALALADGQFTQEAVLHVTDSTLAPPAEAGEQADVWELALTGTDLTESDTVPIRLLNRGGGRASVWQYTGGQWHAVEASSNGHYLLLTMTGTSGIFCVCSRQSGSVLPLAAALAAMAVLLAVIIVRHIRRKKAAARQKAAANK